MESSRIFITGLPPTITEKDFKKHFSATAAITDAKLIPHRRIGYIGYKTPQDAAKAVQYFNRSFIRMSRIGVELARPIADAALPISRKARREQAREKARTIQNQQRDRETTSKDGLNAAVKRKRSSVDEEDPKLKEFLEVMKPASKSKKLVREEAADEMDEPPYKIQAIEAPEAESDDEYESVPERKRKDTPPKPSAPLPEPAIVVESNSTAGADELKVDFNAPNANATDEDWLRGRTNRLLDLMDPDEMAPVQAPQPPAIEDFNDAAVDATIGSADDAAGEQDETVEERVEEAEADVVEEPKFENGRLFIRNLSYTTTEDELKTLFEPYGALEEVHIPVDAAGTRKGFAFVQYSNSANAGDAFHNLDGEPFQGRLMHILSATDKREQKLDEFAIAKLPLKKQQLLKKKAEFESRTFNWNSLFMNQDAVNTAIAARLGISKSDLLDPTSADAGVKQAIAETTVIQESKAYFVKNGVDLDAFKNFKKRERGDTVILVKNFPYGTTLEELRKMFEEHGQVLRVLMPPAGTIAIVEFAQPTHARAAYTSLAYTRMKNCMLFLEKAPKNLFTSASSSDVVANDPHVNTDLKLSASDLLERESAAEALDTTTLFVRNLNFSTTSDLLTRTFKPLDGFLSARVNTKPDPKHPGQALSMGFGFLEFKTKSQAQAALKAMDGYMLEGHKLLIKASHKGADAAEERRKEDRAKKMAGRRTKIIIKNLPFEATKKDVRDLFSTYGQLRSVRVPKKFDHSARGFAFADFITAREAENALEALKDTHLLGRRLVLEFAVGDTLDAEEEIEKMQKKVSGQVNKIALQNLTGGGRKKFNVQGNDEEGG